MSNGRTIFALAFAVVFLGSAAPLAGAASAGPDDVQASLQTEATRMVSPPDPGTYALHLVDGRTAIVWYDAHTTGQPQWVCEVPAKRDGSDAQRISISVGAAEWRVALAEATRLLDGLVADGE